MYELVETGRDAAEAATYPTLHAAVDGLIRRADALMRAPGARPLMQRPLRFVIAGADGALTTLCLRRHHSGEGRDAGGSRRHSTPAERGGLPDVRDAPDAAKWSR
jgi:hypothetical protein